MSGQLTAIQRELPALSHMQGSLIILATGVGFSFGGLAFRSVDIGAWEYLFFRGLGMGIVAVFVLAARYRGRVGDLLGRVGPAHIVAGLVLGAMNVLFIVSLTFASVAFVLLLQTLAPVTASYFSWLFLRERPTSSVVVATVIALIGVSVMVGGTVTNDLSSAGLLALLIPVGFGLYTTLIRSAERIDAMVPLVVGGGGLIMAGVVAALAQGGFTASPRDAATGIFAGSVLLALPLAAFNTAQRVVPAPESALLIMTEIVLAPIWVWLFVGEQATTSTIVGGAIVMGAMVWLTMRRVPKRGRRPITTRG